MEEDWRNDRINQELIHGPISLLSFQCIRKDTVWLTLASKKIQKIGAVESKQK